MKLFRIAFAGIALTAAFLGSSPSFVHGKTLEPVWQSNFKSMQPGCCRAENRQFQFSKPFGEFKKRSWNSSAPEPRPIDSFIKDHKKELYLLALPQKETLLETNRGLYEGMSVILVNGSLRESPSLETCRKFVGIVQ